MGSMSASWSTVYCMRRAVGNAVERQAGLKKFSCGRVAPKKAGTHPMLVRLQILIFYFERYAGALIWRALSVFN